MKIELNSDEILKNKKLIGVFIVIIISIVGFVGVQISSKGGRKQETETKKENVLPEGAEIPKVPKSVKVDIETVERGREILLSISGIPEGTEEIEYELSYLASGDLPKGVIGTIKVSGSQSVERQITLGTCSSGRCVYDEGVESISVSLKFNGDYGSKLFEKEFEL